MQTSRIPLTIRLAGLWVIWAAWCQCSGWGLSTVHQLDGRGYLAAAPVLFAGGWLWLRATTSADTPSHSFRLAKFRRRFSRLLPLVYLGIAVLSLVSAWLYTPWSFDAATYRLPRLLYWWAAHRWYWIGTLDHRLDYSSCGYEWQMLPFIIFTRTDRLIFLLSWIPFLLMPGLVFCAFRGLGVNRRSAWRWMWLLSSGFCYALQCSGLQNDGYTVNYTLVAIAFAVIAFRRCLISYVWLSLLAVALLAGAKLSNVPLLLPLGLLLLPALRVVDWFNWKAAIIVFIAVVCSFVPLAFLCWKHTGDWTGDPTNQYNLHQGNAAGTFVASTIVMVNDFAQPPIFPFAKKINAELTPLNETAFMQWIRRAFPDTGGIHFGDMAYEGNCGLGGGINFYTLFLLVGCWFVKPSARKSIGTSGLPWEWRLAPWTAWLSLGVLMAQLATRHTPRYAAPYYPLLFISILALPRITALERRRIAALISMVAMVAVVPVIFLTPARPMIPIELIARIAHGPALETAVTKYRLWAGMRDDLGPMRDALPTGTTKLGYAGAFRDTSYGLWKPLGSRVVTELGLPPHHKTPPLADLDYAVVTERGVRERYDMNLDAWCDFARAKIVFKMERNTSLEGETAKYDTWYLVRFQHD